MSLETVIAGDTLVIDSSRWTLRLATVDRVTKTQIIVGDSRFRKRDGRLVGNQGRWTFTHIRRPRNDEEIITIQSEERRRTLAHRIANKCEHHRLRDLSLEALEELNTAVQKVVP